jgi:2-desacetyl-2-hydroxyethyl bacteriochlorophyllide A dehydrogenase
MRSHHLTLAEPFHLRWDELDVPDPGPGEVLIETRKTLISTGTELTAYMGDFPPDSVWSDYVVYPWRGLGYSNVGRVAALGPGVDELEVGQRVMSNGRHATLNLRPVTGVWPIPDDITDDQAVFLDIGRTVMNGVRLARIAFGESVVIIGAGILGQLATQYLSRSGACPLTVIDLSEWRLEMASAHGATHTLLGGRDGLLADIRRITRARMADVAFEVTGNEVVIPSILQVVRPMGRVILLGSPRHPVMVNFHNEVHTLGLQIIGAHTSTQAEVETGHSPWTRVRNSEVFFDLTKLGWLRLDAMITHRVDWRDAPSAYQMLASDRSRALGVVLEGWGG